MTARPEISLASAAYLGLALQALRAGDLARFAELVASIDETSWALIIRRLPGLPSLVERGAA